MKFALVFIALLAVGSSAPQTRKLFHEHFEEFINIIMEEASSDLEYIVSQYVQYEEFQQAVDYLSTKNFKDLILEMESLPEFQAVVDFLENDNIDIHFFLDILDDVIAEITRKHRQAAVTGKDFTSYINDCIAVFPKDRLAALFEEKLANDAEFKVAIENLYSEEWSQVFGALWDNETFQKEVKTLTENGIDVDSLFKEVIAIFGQN